MATHGYGASFSQHSQTSNNDESSKQYYPQILPAPPKGTGHLLAGDNITTSPFVLPPPSPPFLGQYNILPVGPHGSGGGRGKSDYRGSSGNISANMRRKMKQTRKPKGRPPGSKNKPKPAIMDEEALKHAIIEISAGCDVVEELIKFAESNDVGLTVLSGSGSIANVTLNSHAFSNNAPPSLTTFHGTFTVLSLSGTFVKKTQCFSSPNVASSSSELPQNPSFPLAVPSSPVYSCFTICLAGSQGEIFGGVVAGRMIAASLVVVVAASYRKPMFHRILKQNGETNNKSLNNVVDLSDVDDDDEEVLKGGTNNDSFMALLASFKDVVSSSSPMNSQTPGLPPT